MKTILAIILILSSFVAHAYQQPTLEEIRKRQAENAKPEPVDPFTRMMVEIIIPEGITVFIDPMSGCHYFVTTDEGKPTSITPRLKRDGTQICE